MSRNTSRLRMAVSAIALLSFTVQPVMAQGKGGKDAVLNACATQREPLQKLDKEYSDLRKSKMSAAIGEGLKSGAMVLGKAVMSGGIPIGRGGSGGGFGGMGGLGAMGGLANMALQGASAQQQAQAGGAPAAATGMMFGQDMLAGAMGLNVPGVSGLGGFGGDSGKGYAALAVLVAIVATADAYAKLKEQEAGGDLKKASFNIDQDAGRQLAVSRSIADSGSALVECRSAQLTDINTRLAGASNDKDRKAIQRERTDLNSALKKDIDLTGGVLDQHTNMAKTFTQGRAMTDGSSEAEVLGNQAPAYATSASVTKVSMPKSAAPAQGQAQQAAPAAAPPPALVAVKPAVVRSAPVASAAPVKSLAVGAALQAKTSAADGGWWEVEVDGQSGYVRAAEVGPPGSAPAAPPPVQTAAKGGPKGKGPPPKAAAAPPPPPAPVGPSNIRAYNQSVIAARDTGKGRLSSLMTDIQASQRKESVLYALLSNWRLG